MQRENRRFFLGVFGSEDDILGATHAAREKGLTIVDVYAPYAVHGLEKAMGLRYTRLPLFTLAMGLLGAGLKIWFEFWTTAVSWPINIGGKPWNSLPAFIPVTFEVMVLFAGLGTVVAFFVGQRLFPWRKARLPVAGVTDDRFALVLEETDASFDKSGTQEMFEKFNVLEVLERVEQESVR
jgi:Alternative complex III, ActD subunit